MNLFKIKSLLLFTLISALVLSSSYIFISTVHDLQFTNSEYFKDQALSYRIKSNKLKASRGNIYDTNLNVVASSSRSFNIGVFPKQISNVGEVSAAIGVILNLDQEKILEKIVSFWSSSLFQKHRMLKHRFWTKFSKQQGQTAEPVEITKLLLTTYMLKKQKQPSTDQLSLTFYS